MQISLWLIPALAFTGACTATLLACRWWYQRKLEALAQRLQKSEKARLFSSQQTLQARRQIEALQKDMAVQQQAMAEAQVARQKSRHLGEALKAVAEADEEATLALPQNHGFADTQPMA